jgi:hypothetical protein
MKRLVVTGFCGALTVELLALLLVPDRRFVWWISGGAAALVLLGVRLLLAREMEPQRASASDDPAESLRRWLSRTETLIAWSESSRSDWDKHLRPMLARQFELATGQRKTKDPVAFYATARVLFGDELWAWVDPDNVARTGGGEPGPGRAALDEILRRLERV